MATFGERRDGRERRETPAVSGLYAEQALVMALSCAVLFARQHAVLYLACASSVRGEQTRTLLLQEARPHQGRGGSGGTAIAATVLRMHSPRPNLRRALCVCFLVSAFFRFPSPMFLLYRIVIVDGFTEMRPKFRVCTAACSLVQSMRLERAW